MRVLCDGWYVVKLYAMLVCGVVLCVWWYVVKFYMIGGMW